MRACARARVSLRLCLHVCLSVCACARTHTPRNSAAIVKADGMGAVVALLELLLPEPRAPLINICVEVRRVRVCASQTQSISMILLKPC